LFITTAKRITKKRKKVPESEIHSQRTMKATVMGGQRRVGEIRGEKKNPV